MLKKLKNIRLLSLLILLLSSSVVTAQCAMCRAVLISAEEQGTAQAINNGIVYLMAVPYVLIGGLGFFIYLYFRKK